MNNIGENKRAREHDYTIEPDPKKQKINENTFLYWTDEEIAKNDIDKISKIVLDFYRVNFSSKTERTNIKKFLTRTTEINCKILQNIKECFIKKINDLNLQEASNQVDPSLWKGFFDLTRIEPDFLDYEEIGIIIESLNKHSKNEEISKYILKDLCKLTSPENKNEELKNETILKLLQHPSIEYIFSSSTNEASKNNKESLNIILNIGEHLNRNPQMLSPTYFSKLIFKLYDEENNDENERIKKFFIEKGFNLAQFIIYNVLLKIIMYEYQDDEDFMFDLKLINNLLTKETIPNFIFHSLFIIKCLKLLQQPELNINASREITLLLSFICSNKRFAQVAASSGLPTQLLKLVDSQDPSIQINCYRSIAYIGITNPGVLTKGDFANKLLNYIETDSNTPRSINFLTALNSMQMRNSQLLYKEGAMEIFIRLFKGPNKDLRMQAFNALCKMVKHASPKIILKMKDNGIIEIFGENLLSNDLQMAKSSIENIYICISKSEQIKEEIADYYSDLGLIQRLFSLIKNTDEHIRKYVQLTLIQLLKTSKFDLVTNIGGILSFLEMANLPQDGNQASQALAILANKTPNQLQNVKTVNAFAKILNNRRDLDTIETVLKGLTTLAAHDISFFNLMVQHHIFPIFLLVLIDDNLFLKFRYEKFLQTLEDKVSVELGIHETLDAYEKILVKHPETATTVLKRLTKLAAQEDFFNLMASHPTFPIYLFKMRENILSPSPIYQDFLNQLQTNDHFISNPTSGLIKALFSKEINSQEMMETRKVVCMQISHIIDNFETKFNKIPVSYLMQAIYNLFSTETQSQFLPKQFPITINTGHKDLKRNSYPDIRFRVKNKIFRCHKHLLHLSSEYFKKMFGPNFKEHNESIIEINDIEPESFERMINFVYASQHRIDSMAELAELILLFEQYLFDANLSTCFSILASLKLPETANEANIDANKKLEIKETTEALNLLLEFNMQNTSYSKILLFWIARNYHFWTGERAELLKPILHEFKRLF